jgi:hypothetical protein
MRGSTGGLTLAVVGAALLLFLAATTALADGSGGPKPTIESESALHIAATDATLEATIDPGTGEDGFALETTYEFFLESPWCGSVRPFGGCEASGGALVYKGTIAGGASAPQLESVDLDSVGQTLSPSTTYGYRVVAHNEVGEAFGFEKTFTTLAEGEAPAIESVRVSHLTKTDATLEATIDTEGLETEYAFHMISSPCSKKGDGCELIVPIELPCGGKLFGSFVPQTVSLDLNSVGVELGEGEYVFGLTASNEAGETGASGGTFEAPEEVAVAMPEVEVVKPHGSGVTPGPVSNELEVPLTGGQHVTSGGNGSAPAGTSTPAAVSSKPAHGKPGAKHGKRRKGTHHGKQRSARGHRRRKH